MIAAARALRRNSPERFAPLCQRVESEVGLEQLCTNICKLVGNSSGTSHRGKTRERAYARNSTYIVPRYDGKSDATEHRTILFTHFPKSVGIDLAHAAELTQPDATDTRSSRRINAFAGV